jgi:hypothetical protein
MVFRTKANVAAINHVLIHGAVSAMALCRVCQIAHHPTTASKVHAAPMALLFRLLSANDKSKGTMRVLGK